VTPLSAVALDAVRLAGGPLPPSSLGKPVTSASAQLPKLVKAAGEFESMLLESLWKSMKETFTDPDDPDSDPTVQSFDDWSIQSMAGAVGSAGGLGIKNMIIKYLEPDLPVSAPQVGPNR
jgi:Rod binding domain-containing protein